MPVTAKAQVVLSSTSENGEVVQLAAGSAGPFVLDPVATPVANPKVDVTPAGNGTHVYHFVVPLASSTSVLPRNGMTMSMTLSFANAACTAGVRILPDHVAMHAGPQGRARLEVPVESGLRVDFLHIETAEGATQVHGRISALWGVPYLNVSSISMQLDGRPVSHVVSYPSDDRHAVDVTAPIVGATNRSTVVRLQGQSIDGAFTIETSTALGFESVHPTPSPSVATLAVVLVAAIGVERNPARRAARSETGRAPAE